MMQLIAIALGGSAGALARFFVANGIYSVLGRGFPHGTLFVNVSGSFLMGFLAELFLQRLPLAAEYRAAVLVGFLGAYTTFSTFALETLYLFEEGSLFKAFLNIFLSTALCIAGVWFGLVWGRAVFAGTGQPWLGADLHILEFALSMLAALLLASLLGFAFQRMSIPPEMRAVAMVLLLGLLTVASTLWLVFRVSRLPFELQGLLTLFVINALCGGAVIWLGNRLGHWLWQLTLPR